MMAVKGESELTACSPSEVNAAVRAVPRFDSEQHEDEQAFDRGDEPRGGEMSLSPGTCFKPRITCTRSFKARR
jgi:hypothetical protein